MACRDKWPLGSKVKVQRARAHLPTLMLNTKLILSQGLEGTWRVSVQILWIQLLALFLNFTYTKQKKKCKWRQLMMNRSDGKNRSTWLQFSTDDYAGGSWLRWRAEDKGGQEKGCEAGRRDVDWWGAVVEGWRCWNEGLFRLKMLFWWLSGRIFRCSRSLTSVLNTLDFLKLLFNNIFLLYLFCQTATIRSVCWVCNDLVNLLTN